MEKLNKIESIQRTIDEIREGCTEVISNMVSDRLNSEILIGAYRYNGAVAYIVYEKRRKNLYFVANCADDLIYMLKHIPEDAYCDLFYKEESILLNKILEEAGWSLCSKYYRTTRVYKENPNAFPLTGRRAILQELYDPTFGEYATVDDIGELMSLFDKYFDEKMDDYYDELQWKDIVEKGQCLIHKENNEIVTAYVFRIEKNKLYSSMTLNLGPANWSYNVERRVLDMAWDMGIRIHYWWTRADNMKAVVRQVVDDKALKGQSLLFNDIYTNKK